MSLLTTVKALIANACVGFAKPIPLDEPFKPGIPNRWGGFTARLPTPGKRQKYRSRK